MTSGYSIVWTDEALNELDKVIGDLTARWTAKEANRFFRELEKKLQLIALNPTAFAASSYRADVRRCVVSKQTSLFYEVVNVTVRIVSVMDNRSNPDALNL